MIENIIAWILWSILCVACGVVLGLVIALKRTISDPCEYTHEDVQEAYMRGVDTGYSMKGDKNDLH